MRPLPALLTVATLAAAPLAAQRLWTPEIGVQGGIARFKPAGTVAPDQSDLFDLPGFSSGYGPLFVVIPVGARLALEPSIGLTQASVGASSIGLFIGNTNADLGLRADYAITSHAFAALGGALIYSESGGQHDAQFGVQAALGYRAPLSSRITARLEAIVVAMARGTNDQLPPADLYAVLLGLSARAKAAPLPARRSAAAAPWAAAFGVAAGYTRTHLSGLGATIDFTLLAAPGTVAGAGLAAPPTLFTILPLTGRYALETGFDIHRTQTAGTTQFNGLISTRLDFAFGSHWYAATGPALHINKSTGSSAFGVAGLGLAWGHRFHLSGDLGGRVELGYMMFKQRSGFPFASNTLAVMFGATMPLH